MSLSTAFGGGALYLILLGVWTWRSATARPVDAGPRRTALPWTGRSTYVQAPLGNVLNPKAASIYLTLLPQFLIPGQPVFGQVLVLATAHAILMFIWLFAWTALGQEPTAFVTAFESTAP